MNFANYFKIYLESSNEDFDYEETTHFVSYFSLKMFDNNPDLIIDHVLDMPDLFHKYPYLKNVYLRVLKDNHPFMNGEPARAQTWGDGEGTICLNIKYCRDGLLSDENKRDMDNRKHVEYMVLHELCHCVQDRDDRLDDYGHDPKITEELENEANEFARYWQNTPLASY